ncbi:YunC family protein [Haloplasma contractile]|uniref:RNA binding protein n=1 Tax=Haloplasma contractile SSD-17B TaxID=1033810 RepID=U2FKP2_9MOLU|nr:DUF1805 domain-containing protein [Haloplasma contractile]ERJ13365.1 RNA binding protein [Haloplasma contractile SSD-17B]
MFNVNRITIEDKEFYTYQVKLPKTNLLVISNDVGYFMCGALDVAVFDSKPHLQARKVICGRALGVKTIDDLLNAPLKEVTKAAEQKGITEGMIVRDALLKLD